MCINTLKVNSAKKRFGCFLLIALFCSLWRPAIASEEALVYVAKTSGCGCCIAWIEHLERSGLTVKSQNMVMGSLMQFKLQSGISAELASCHTARVGGYTIEGHVPEREIRRLLTEKPEVVGLAVPGMPLGSPGMDQGPDREAYDVLLIRADGLTEVYATYPLAD
ncbi:MAG: DUF411 domain-containing protein [Pseudomonadales bacterium]|jgi:hypothetical protein